MFLGDVLGCFLDALGVFSECFGDVFWMVWGCFLDALGMSSGCIGNVFWMFSGAYSVGSLRQIRTLIIHVNFFAAVRP